MNTSSNDPLVECTTLQDESPITVSTESTLRVPITMNGNTSFRRNKKYCIIPFSSTPKSITKVESWFEKCSSLNTKAENISDEKAKLNKKLLLTKIEHDTMKSKIILKYEFKKDDNGDKVLSNKYHCDLENLNSDENEGNSESDIFNLEKYSQDSENVSCRSEIITSISDNMNCKPMQVNCNLEKGSLKHNSLKNSNGNEKFNFNLEGFKFDLSNSKLEMKDSYLERSNSSLERSTPCLERSSSSLERRNFITKKSNSLKETNLEKRNANLDRSSPNLEECKFSLGSTYYSSENHSYNVKRRNSDLGRYSYNLGKTNSTLEKVKDNQEKINHNQRISKKLMRSHSKKETNDQKQNKCSQNRILLKEISGHRSKKSFTLKLDVSNYKSEKTSCNTEKANSCFNITNGNVESITNYNVQISSCHIGKSNYHSEVSNFKPEISNYNPEVDNYNPEMTSYNPKISCFNPEISNYHAEISKSIQTCSNREESPKRLNSIKSKNSPEKSPTRTPVKAKINHEKQEEKSKSLMPINFERSTEIDEKHLKNNNRLYNPTSLIETPLYTSLYNSSPKSKRPLFYSSAIFEQFIEKELQNNQSEDENLRKIKNNTEPVKFRSKSVEGSPRRHRKSTDSEKKLKVNKKEMINGCGSVKNELNLQLSPESRKKNEFCSYLQLMDLNYSNVNQLDILRNRRSTRMQSLILMTKKQEYMKASQANIDENKEGQPNNNSTENTIVVKLQNRRKSNSFSDKNTIMRLTRQNSVDVLSSSEKSSLNGNDMESSDVNLTMRSFSELGIKPGKLPPNFYSPKKTIDICRDFIKENVKCNGVEDFEVTIKQYFFIENINAQHELKYMSENRTFDVKKPSYGGKRKNSEEECFKEKLEKRDILKNDKEGKTRKNTSKNEKVHDFLSKKESKVKSTIDQFKVKHNLINFKNKVKSDDLKYKNKSKLEVNGIISKDIRIKSDKKELNSEKNKLKSKKKNELKSKIENKLKIRKKVNSNEKDFKANLRDKSKSINSKSENEVNKRKRKLNWKHGVLKCKIPKLDNSVNKVDQERKLSPEKKKKSQKSKSSKFLLRNKKLLRPRKLDIIVKLKQKKQLRVRSRLISKKERRNNSNKIDLNKIGVNKLNVNKIDTNRISKNEFATEEINSKKISLTKICPNKLDTNQTSANTITVSEKSVNDDITQNIDMNKENEIDTKNQFVVKILCNKETKVPESKKCLVFDKTHVMDTSSLLPEIENLKNKDLFMKLAPEHLKSLVESKMFLKKKNEDLQWSPDTKPVQHIKIQKVLPNSPMKSASSTDQSIPEEISFMKDLEDSSDDIFLEEEKRMEVLKQNLSSTNTELPKVGSTINDADSTVIQDEPEVSIPSCIHSKENPKFMEHSYCESESSDSINSSNSSSTTANSHTIIDEQVEEVAVNLEIVDTNEISSTNCKYIPISESSEVKSLHKSLLQKKKVNDSLFEENSSDSHSNWEREDLVNEKKPKTPFSLNINLMYGSIVNVNYVDFNLVVVQELAVSFWNQTALGNILGSQDMWVPKGSVQKLILDSECSQKSSNEVVYCSESSTAYIELWIKEHKSFNRERPVADVFAIVYFRKSSKPEKKVLQLENIKGFGEDVRYVVMRSCRCVVVSWRVLDDNDKITIVHCYNLAPDFQSVESIKELEKVNHYVTSLHNIEDCDNIVMGCGDQKVTFWNIKYGYVVASIDISDHRPESSTLWAKSDRGFLFMIQCFTDDILQLTAINGIKQEWKLLKMFKASKRHRRLKGICIESGILAAFYETGVCSWNIETAECIIDEIVPESIFVPSSKHVLLVMNEEIQVQQAFSYLLTLYDT